MIPIDDKVRDLFIKALDNEADALTSEMDEARTNVDRPSTPEDLATMEGVINEYETLLRRLKINELLIFDSRPRCMVNDGGQQCASEGRYQPFVMVHTKSSPQPIAQLAVQPVLRICHSHAVNNIEKYLPQEAWREVQAQVMRQSQQVVAYDDARIMYMDHETKTMIAAPSVTLATV